MASNDKFWSDPESGFSFGLSELRQAGAARELKPFAPPPPKEKIGFDPYNTSGSFDRKKNWNRVGKR